MKDPEKMPAIRSLIIPLSLLVLVTSVRADDQDVIDYREHIMKTMGEQADAIGMILEHKAPADNLATHVRILAISASTAKQAFEPKVLGGEAKANVWAQWPDFAKRLDALSAATSDLAKVATDGGLAAVASKADAAFTCKSCHDTYREEKKK
jgi:cytochrome c556